MLLMHLASVMFRS